MSGVPDSIVALLREAGWQAPPDDGARDPAGERLLASLAGLSLGKTGAGRETAASDVAFYERPCEPDEDESLEGLPWRGRTGPLRAVADAHHNHMIVLLDAAGAAYVYTVPDGKLYRLGASLGEALERLLLGIGYGPAIDEDD